MRTEGHPEVLEQKSYLTSRESLSLHFFRLHHRVPQSRESYRCLARVKEYHRLDRIDFFQRVDTLIS
jgi:hypothetical protein